MVKEKDNCFKCGVLTDDLISFYMIDDWSQFEIKLCQDCTSKANIQGFESSEEWLCPICKKVYCCTICGDKNHHTKLCSHYIPDSEDLPFYFKQFFSSFRKKSLHWFVHTPYGIYHLGEVDQEEINRKIARERTEMQSLLMLIRKKARDKMPEICELIKYYFNSKYGEMGEGIMSRAVFGKKVLEDDTEYIIVSDSVDFTFSSGGGIVSSATLSEKIKEFISRSTVDNDSDWDFDDSLFQSIINKSKATISKKVLEQAIYKHAIYQDTDSFILNMLEIKDVLKKIIDYPVNRDRIFVIGDRGTGKSSVVIALIEKWREIDSIDSEMIFLSGSETWRVYWKQKKYHFHIIPSLDFRYNDDIFKQTCLIINVEQRIDYTKEMKVILYWLSKKTNNTDIIMVSQAVIPYCSNEGYEQYKDKKLKKMKEFMDK